MNVDSISPISYRPSVWRISTWFSVGWHLLHANVIDSQMATVLVVANRGCTKQSISKVSYRQFQQAQSNVCNLYLHCVRVADTTCRRARVVDAWQLVAASVSGYSQRQQQQQVAVGFGPASTGVRRDKIRRPLFVCKQTPAGVRPISLQSSVLVKSPPPHGALHLFCSYFLFTVI